MGLRDELRSVTKLWLKQVTFCRQHKQKVFGKTADLAWGFLGKSYKSLYLDNKSEFFLGGYQTKYKPRINKSRQFVSVYMPHILARVPDVLVTPRRMPLPDDLLGSIFAQDPEAVQRRIMVEQDDRIRANLLQCWLEYLWREIYNLHQEARESLPEGLVKGRGVVWHEKIPLPQGGFAPISEQDTVDGLLSDADAKKLRDAGYVIRIRQQSAWQLEKKFGIKRDLLRGLNKSHHQQAKEQASEFAEENNDICIYYEVYSRMGMGYLLPSAVKESGMLAAAMDSLGPHIYLAVMDGLDYPLNLPPELLEVGTLEEVQGALEWPIPFYANVNDPWPMTEIDFIPNSTNTWATSPLEGGMPIQVFLDYLYGFLMSRAEVASRNILLVSKALEEELVQKLQSGGDLSIVGVSDVPSDIKDKLVQFIEFPQLNKDLWAILSLLEREFEAMTDMTPLLQGREDARAFRSATEADVRDRHAMSRPEEFADTVERWFSRIASKDGFASRMIVTPDVIAPLLGEPVPVEGQNVYGPLMGKWLELVYSEDADEAAAQVSYSVEAGSGRRKNRQALAADIGQITQVLLQPMFQLAVTQGYTDGYNALVEMLGEQMQMPLARLKLPAMQPMQPGAPEEEGGEQPTGESNGQQ